MPELVWNALGSGCALAADMPHWSKNAKLTLKREDVLEIEFGAVAYSGAGQGKYGEQSAFVPAGRFDRLIDDNESKTMMPPPGKGWRPVCRITWRNMHLHHGYPCMASYERAVRSGKQKCYVLCWYQLVDGGRIIAVWAIIFIDE